MLPAAEVSASSHISVDVPAEEVLASAEVAAEERSASSYVSEGYWLLWR